MPAWLPMSFASMSMSLAKYLICYDITDPKRLRRVHHAVRDLGLPIQFSVFEAELNTKQLAQLITQLTRLIEVTEDKIMIYQLNRNHPRIDLGIAAVTEDVLFI